MRIKYARKHSLFYYVAVMCTITVATEQIRVCGVAIAQWLSVRLSIGRLGIPSTATELVAAALLGQERSPQPPRQEAQFRLRPAANCRRQFQTYIGRLGLS